MRLKKFDIKDFDEYTCMYNSYLVLTGRETYESILNREDGAGFIFNPTEVMVPLQDDAYDILIDYFAEEEEYEKCSELKQSKHFLKSLFI